MPNHHDYTGFTEEQFASDEYFQQWIRLEQPYNEFWESHMLLYPNQQETLLRARRIVEELASGGYGDKPLSQEEKKEIKLNIYRRLRLSADTEGVFTLFPIRKISWLPRAVAAAAVVVIAIPVYFWLKQAPSKIIPGNDYAYNVIRTGSGEMKKIILQDSTVVMLNANSTLQYSNNTSGHAIREVQIEGNAFFSVKKDRQHTPFIVRAHDLAITVLGTELNVNARSGETEVELTSGKVKVEQNGSKEDAVYLKPGEKLRLDTAEKTMVKSEMNAQLYFAWTKGEWHFRQTTLGEITGLIHEYYGVDIVFRKEKSKGLRIDAVLPVTGLQNLISVIEHTLQINIQVINNQLIVQ